VAETDPVAQQMVNFVYLIGDRETGEAVVVDPAYDPAGHPRRGSRPTA
jgi:glyoxylase-like metal-dependent hydrolase (beta-lactamase superfamily II)